MIDPGLYLVLNLDWHLRDGVSPVELCRKVLRGGCSAVQIRFKEAFDSIVLDVAGRLRRVTEKARVPFIVNDRPDIALLCGADGVHVGQEDLEPRVVSGLSRGLFVGLSTHTLDQVRVVPGRYVDYIGFGPVFGTISKKSPWPATGLAGLREAASASRVPLVAIGGIDERRCRRIVAAGVRRAAVLSAVYCSSNPSATARVIHEAMLR